MPYIKTERVAEIRKELKTKYPLLKLSVVCRNYDSVHIYILAAPFEMRSNPERGDEQVNKWHIEKRYEALPETVKILKDMFAIAGKGCGTESVDGDYGTIPDWYVDVTIGRWDRPFEIKA